MINKMTLLGRLGKDPELRETKNGKVCTASVATDHSRKINDEWKKETTWHRVIVWGKRGETLAKHGEKGDVMYFEGRMSYRQYDDKDGNKRLIAEVVADEMKFTKPLSKQPSTVVDDDIPF